MMISLPQFTNAMVTPTISSQPVAAIAYFFSSFFGDLTMQWLLFGAALMGKFRINPTGEGDKIRTDKGQKLSAFSNKKIKLPYK